MNKKFLLFFPLLPIMILTTFYPALAVGRCPDNQIEIGQTATGQPVCREQKTPEQMEAENERIQKLITPTGGTPSRTGGTPGPTGGTPSFLNQTIRIPNPLRADSFEELINAIVDFLLLLAAPIATLMIIWGAFKIMTGAAEPAKVSEGKETITWAVVGYGILLISKGLILIIQNLLGG